MAIIKIVNSKASLGNAINYVTDREKTEDKLISGIECSPTSAIDEMKVTKDMHGKNGGRQYTHIVQSFNPNDDISAEKAHELGREFIEGNDKFKGHEVLIATHTNKDHMHNHFIINSVNYETGKKLHTNKKDLELMKKQSNELSRDNGLTVPVKGGDVQPFNSNKYHALKNGFEGRQKSYVLDTALDVKNAAKESANKKEFIENMNKRGYQVNWTDERKHITFTNSDDKKVRNSNLAKTFKDDTFTKEGLQNEFDRTENDRAIEQRNDKISEGKSLPLDTRTTDNDKENKDLDFAPSLSFDNENTQQRLNADFKNVLGGQLKSIGNFAKGFVAPSGGSKKMSKEDIEALRIDAENRNREFMEGMTQTENQRMAEEQREVTERENRENEERLKNEEYEKAKANDDPNEWILSRRDIDDDDELRNEVKDYDNEFEGTRAEYGNENAIKKDNRTQRDYDELYSSSHERGHAEEDNDRQRASEDSDHEREYPKQNDFDIEQARDHAEGEQHETATEYGRWVTDNASKQSIDIDKDGADKQDDRERTIEDEREQQREMERDDHDYER